MSKCPVSLIQIALIATIGGIMARSQMAIAQVTIDSSSGSSVSFDGDKYWTIGSGIRQSNSLFHNLADFKIPEGGTAEFQVNPELNPNIDRVIVHIKNAAIVNGTISISEKLPNGSFEPKTADLFFLSPNGIIFGSSAFLDIRGALFATTANKITFNDGVIFENGVSNSVSGSLTTHQPIGFGFGPTPGSIRLLPETTPIGNNPINLNLGSNLTSLAFLGGDIELKNRGLQAPTGGLYLGSVQGNTTIQLGPQSMPVDRLDLIYPTQLNQLGLIQLTHRSFLTSETGNIEVTAKDIRITEYFIIDGEYLGGYVGSETGDITFAGQNIQIEATGINYNNGDVTFTSGSNTQGQLNLSMSGINKSSPEGTGTVALISQTIDMERFGISCLAFKLHFLPSEPLAARDLA
jgi:filamentous hemagglutinin family protein